MATLIEIPHPGRFTVPELRFVHDRMEEALAHRTVPPLLATALAAFADRLKAAEVVEHNYQVQHSAKANAAAAADLRRSIGRRVSWLHDVLAKAVALGHDTPEAQLATAVLTDAFPRGLAPVLQVPDTTRAATVDALVRTLAMPVHAVALREFGLTSQLARLRPENDQFAALIAGVHHPTVDGHDVAEAVSAATEALYAVPCVAATLATTDPVAGGALSDAVAWPYLDMIEEKRSRVRAHRRAKAAARAAKEASAPPAAAPPEAAPTA